MFIVTLLRFNWVFYIIFAGDNQHSTVISFLISLTEALRRWIWAFFRMENEHCTNVGNFRAYREIPLPYELPPQCDLSSEDTEDISHYKTSISRKSPSLAEHYRSLSAPNFPENSTFRQHQGAPSIIHEQSDLEHQFPSSPRPIRGSRFGETLQQKGVDASTPTMRALNAMGSALARAHTQDFERRKSRVDSGRSNTDDDDDDDDDDSSQASEDDAEEQIPVGHRRSRTISSMRSFGKSLR